MVNICFSSTNSLTFTRADSKEENEMVNLQVKCNHVDLFESNPSEYRSLEN